MFLPSKAIFFLLKLLRHQLAKKPHAPDDKHHIRFCYRVMSRELALRRHSDNAPFFYTRRFKQLLPGDQQISLR
jgi:hypothetical protein